MLMMNFVHAPATTADHGQPVHLIYTVTFQSASFFSITIYASDKWN